MLRYDVVSKPFSGLYYTNCPYFFTSLDELYKGHGHYYHDAQYGSG